MDYTIDCGYRWYVTENSADIVLMFFICNIPFTFNQIPKKFKITSEIIHESNCEVKWTLNMLYDKSAYLIDEQCHPLLFSLEVENSEILDHIDDYKIS